MFLDHNVFGLNKIRKKHFPGFYGYFIFVTDPLGNFIPPAPISPMVFDALPAKPKMGRSVKVMGRRVGERRYLVVVSSHICSEHLTAEI